MFGRKAVVCNSGTDALFFSLLSLGIGKGDEGINNQLFLDIQLLVSYQ